MTASARDRMAALLAGAGARGSFSAAETAPADGLRLEVRGLGPLVLPVTDEQARRLCSLGRPAPYGRGEQTLVDAAVRDTWEIPKARVKIDKRRWADTLEHVLERLGRDLSLPDGRQLEAQLHSMLVYAPGQFFLRHQDSEKEDAMVGSLVVTLPSAFTGGALEVEHRGEVATYRGSKKALSFVAFYSDCRHQIKPVTSGHRVVLTFDLTLRGDLAASPESAGDPELIEELARYLGQHFEGPAAPSRLVYLLDHEYTPRGLSWSCLKGADVARATMLRTAAGRAGCEATLALADVQETWSAFEPEWGRHRYGRSRRSYRYDEDDDSFEEGAADDYELDELIDSVITLDSWLGSPGGKVEKIGLSIGEGEICASTPSGELSPYASEYEGYMGNWGNTLDRWYHRGALVLWPASLAFAVRAETSPSWALDSLSARARTDLAGAREAAATLAPFWEEVVTRAQERSLLTKALRTARLLEEPTTAAMLSKPFRLEMLVPSHAKALNALMGAYGDRWAQDLIGSWSARRPRYGRDANGTEAWIASLPRLCAGLDACGATGRSAALYLLRDSWAWLHAKIEQTLQLPWPSHRAKALAELGGPVAALLQAASMVGAADLVDEAAGLLCRDDQALVGCAMGVLRAAPREGWGAAGLDAVAGHCRQALEERLGRPPRGAKDWSFQLPRGCDCELCRMLAGFCADPARRVFEWPLAKDRRAHVHSRIDSAELPVSHETRRKGSPHTLVLTKTSALFEREKRARLSDKADLAWIRRQERGSRSTS